MRLLVQLCFSVAVTCAITAAQNTVPLFPCYGGKPTSNGCPQTQSAPTNFSSEITPDDYYDVYVESVCINQPDKWWKKKLVHVEVTIKVGSVNQTVPVYAQRSGSECRIGVANYPIITSVPANNNRLSIASHIYRSDDQDGMRQMLGFLVDQQKNTVLNTYAASAVPYLTAIGDVASQLYKAFASNSQDYQDFRDMDLVPTGQSSSRFDLKDEYIAVYAGSQILDDSSVYLDRSSNLRLVSDDSIVAGGSTWIVFRIQKRNRRIDYVGRSWYVDWENLVRQVETREVDAEAVKKRISTDDTLLNADADFTSGDKDYYTDKFLASEAEMLKYLDNQNAKVGDYRKAVQDASVTPDVTGTGPNGQLVTATSGSKPVVTQPAAFSALEGQKWVLEKLGPSSLEKVIVPEAFINSLKTVNAKAVAGATNR